MAFEVQLVNQVFSSSPYLGADPAHAARRRAWDRSSVAGGRSCKRNRSGRR